MKRLLLMASMLIAPLVFGQSAVTPNLNLKIPEPNVAGWQDLLSYDLYQLDKLLSSNSPLPGITVTGPANLPQLTTWLTTQSYSTGNVVFYLGSPYTSTQNSNQGNLPTNTSFWYQGIQSGGGTATIPATTALLKGTNVAGVATSASISDLFSIEYLGFSSTPTFSVAVYTSEIMLSGAISTFTLPAGGDGQKHCLIFYHDSSSNYYSVTPPTTVRGFIARIGSNPNSFNQQCYTYLAFNSIWLADSPGVINE